MISIPFDGWRCLCICICTSTMHMFSEPLWGLYFLFEFLSCWKFCLTTANTSTGNSERIPQLLAQRKRTSYQRSRRVGDLYIYAGGSTDRALSVNLRPPIQSLCNWIRSVVYKCVPATRVHIKTYPEDINHPTGPSHFRSDGSTTNTRINNRNLFPRWGPSSQ